MQWTGRSTKSSWESELATGARTGDSYRAGIIYFIGALKRLF